MDKDLLLKIIQEKLKKNGNSNSNNSDDGDKNNTEVEKEDKQNVTFVTLNSDNRKEEKLNVTNVTKSTMSSQTSVENSSKGEEEIGETIEIKDNTIIIRNESKRNKVRFEIYYGSIGTIEDLTRIKDLKIPLLPQYEFTAKKEDDTLSLIVTIDFHQIDNRIIYYIRNKSEVVEKLYKFKSDRRISKRLINDALDTWLQKINPQIEWKDLMEVVKNYKEWDEINEDPIQFFMDRSSEIVGNEKLKIAVLLSVVSSQLKKLSGIYRVHLILTGSSGVGKSSTIKSILKMFYEMADGVEDWIILNTTRMTKEALGYLDVDTLDGKVIFVEQLDNVEGVNYLREAMTEGRITTTIPIKDPNTGEIKTVQKIIPGEPAFLTTNVTANVDHQILNRSMQLYLSPAEDEGLKRKIIESILDREEISEEELARIKLITYAWLKSRPKSPKLPAEIKSELMNLLSKFINFRNIYRATEITRNLVRAMASLNGHETISKEDLDFVMRYFKKDIILTTLELSERDLELLRWLRDHGFVEPEKKDEPVRDISTSEIAQVIKMSTQESKKILDALFDKGLVQKYYDGKRFSWTLSHYGVKVLNELEREVEEEQESEEDVIIEDELLAIISSKLMGKDVVKEEELRSILERVAQATDLQVQDMLIKALEKKGIIKSEGDGTWKVL